MKNIDDAINIRERILYSIELAAQLTSDEEKKPCLTYAMIGPLGKAGCISDS